MPQMKVVDGEALDRLCAEARLAPRKRKNLNLHPCDASAAHRLFNALQPGTYIRPHRHLDAEKDETFVIVRGALGIVMFDDAGRVVESCVIRAGGENVAADIPHGVYHTAVALEADSVFFEAKAGPYVPLSDEEKGGFAPEEGGGEVTAYLARLTELFK